MPTSTQLRPVPREAPRPAHPLCAPAHRGGPRLVPVPATEPPLSRDDHGGAQGLCAQGSLALTFPLPSGSPAAPAAPLRLVAEAPRAQPPRPAVPDPEAWARALARGIAEVIAGDRPVTQLVNWTAPGIYARLRLEAALSAPSADRIARRCGSPRRVSVCRISPKAAEVTAAVHACGRARALAFRLELIRDRWVCVALAIG